MLIADGDERVKLSRWVTVVADEALGKDNLDCEKEPLGFVLGWYGGRLFPNDLRHLIDTHLLVHPLKLNPTSLDVVELDAGLWV